MWIETSVECIGFLVTILNLLRAPLPSYVFTPLYQNEGHDLWEVFSKLLEAEQGIKIIEEAFRGMGFYIRQVPLRKHDK